MTFRVGQKVVCVDTWPRSTWRDVWDRFWHPYRSPVKDRTYTVSNIYVSDDQEFVELAELPSPETDTWTAGFFACGFRPAVEPATDIGFAHEILRKASRTRETVA